MTLVQGRLKRQVRGPTRRGLRLVMRTKFRCTHLAFSHIWVPAAGIGRVQVSDQVQKSAWTDLNTSKHSGSPQPGRRWTGCACAHLPTPQRSRQQTAEEQLGWQLGGAWPWPCATWQRWWREQTPASSGVSVPGRLQGRTLHRSLTMMTLGGVWEGCTKMHSSKCCSTHRVRVHGSGVHVLHLIVCCAGVVAPGSKTLCT